MGLALKRALDKGVMDVTIAYDIACKYSVKFWSRVGQYPAGNPLIPSEMQDRIKNSECTIRWLIGKFHLGGHQEECSKKYSFNYNKNVGRMSGELVETVWSDFDWLKYQTREMGPGTRIEMLCDAANNWNWQKIVRMGEWSLP